MNNEAFVIERTYDAPVEKVWQAITDRDQMKQWYFDLEVFRAEVGFEFQFEGGTEHQKYLHHCKVTEVIPGKKLTYSWSYDGYEGISFVTFELYPEGDQTKLKLTHAGLETFPASNKDFAKSNFEAGWNEIIGAMLKDFVETETIRKSILIDVPASILWRTLTQTELTNQWAAGFSEGVTVETDWRPGSQVVWKDKTGNIGARGVVTELQPNKLLQVDYYDSVDAADGSATGKYKEKYMIEAKADQSELTIEAGKLETKYAREHTGLWDKAIELIKTVAEKQLQQHPG